MKRSALPLVWGRNGPGALVADVEAGQGVAVGVAAIARPVVGEHPLDADADLGELADGVLHGPRGARAALVGDGHDDGVAAGVVDEHLEVVVADAAMVAVARPGPAEDPPTAAVGHPAELLVVLVDERARMARDIADRSRGHPVGVAQAVEAGPAEDAVDRRARVPGERRQASRTVAPTGRAPR